MEKKFVVVGSGKLTIQIAEYLIAQGLKTAVYEKAISGVSSVEELCSRKSIPYHAMNDKTMTERLLRDLGRYSLKVISAVNTYIFPREIIQHKNFTGINYHNALLPHHRGMNAEAWAIFDMDKYTGITWHKILPEIDCGEIIVQKKIKIDDSLNSLKLLKQQTALAYTSFLDFAPAFIAGDDLAMKCQPPSDEHIHLIREVPNNGYLSKKWDLDRSSAFLRAMDYGKLDTLSRPMIRLDSKTYVWDRYKIVESQPTDKDFVGFDEGNIIIAKKNCTKKIYLINARRQG